VYYVGNRVPFRIQAITYDRLSYTPHYLPALSKVKMSPSHLTSLLGVLGSELQLERRLRAAVFLLGELGSSADESRSEGDEEKE
jgi:hypothetical protein